jgi:predicted MFS family arabinose efflux permease
LPLISKDLGVGAANAALMVSASTVGLAIGVIPWSALADRIGRVKAISISVTVATLVGMLVPFAPTFSLLLAGRFVEGLMVGGVPAIAVAYLTEEVDPVHAARAAGIFVGGTTIGGLLGRLISSPVAEVAGWRVGIFTVALLCGLAAMGFVKLAPDPRGFTPVLRRDANPEGSLGQRLATNLRTPRQLVLFAQGFLLMGGFVALYNFLGFRLTRAPFHLAPSVVSLMFLAYLAGTWASSRAGAEAARFGRKRVLLVAVAIMMAGVAMTLSDNVIAVLIGLVVATAGFFGAHATAAGWTGQAAPVGKAQASSLYNLFYYAGSSAIGWLGGLAFDARGWTAVAVTILVFAGIAALLAALFLHDD